MKDLSKTEALTTSDVQDGAVVKAPPKHPNPRDYQLTFSTVEIPARQTSNLIIETPVYFRANNLIIPSEIARFFNVVGISIGGHPQMTGMEPVPALIFTEHEAQRNLHFDSAHVGTKIELAVTNITRRKHLFVARLEGVAFL